MVVFRIYGVITDNFTFVRRILIYEFSFLYTVLPNGGRRFINTFIFALSFLFYANFVCVAKIDKCVKRLLACITVSMLD